MADWQGDERRSIPIHILNHIDARLQESTDRTEAQLQEIRSSIKHLTDSVNSWMDRTPAAIIEQCEEMFDEAIPTAKDNPDATPKEKRKEHRRAHAKWMLNVESELESWKKIRSKVAEWAVIGALAAVVSWIVWSINTWLGKQP